MAPSFSDESFSGKPDPCRPCGVLRATTGPPDAEPCPGAAPRSRIARPPARDIDYGILAASAGRRPGSGLVAQRIDHDTSNKDYLTRAWQPCTLGYFNCAPIGQCDDQGMLADLNNCAEGQRIFTGKDGFPTLVEPHVTGLRIVENGKPRGLGQAHLSDELDAALCPWPLSFDSSD